MHAAWTWLRIDAARRWRSLAVLALLVLVAAGTVLTATAGARRASTALPRLVARTLPATARVQPNQPGFDWDRVRAMPEVAAVATLLGGPDVPLDTGGALTVRLGDTALGRTIERPVVLAGRMYDPARPDEAMVSPFFVRSYHRGVGDLVTAHLFTPQQIRAAGGYGDPGPPAGPNVRLRIVGVWRSFEEADDEVGSQGALIPSPGFTARYRAMLYDDAGGSTNALVRLRDGEPALPGFEQHLARLTGRSDIGIWSDAAQVRRTQRLLSFEARCLLAFGLAAGLAELFLIGQAIARFVGGGLAELQVLRALGMTPGQAALAAAAGPTLAALAGAAGGVVAAGVASRWFPIGSASLYEPTPGPRLDLAVLGCGLLVIPLAVLFGSAAVAWLGLRSVGRELVGRRSAVALAAVRAGLPVPVVVGTRFALETGRGRTAVPVRPALLGAVGGVLGVLAAFTFSTGVADASVNPARFGQTWQLATFTGAEGDDLVPQPQQARLYRALGSDRDVTGVTDARTAAAHAGAARTTVDLFTVSPQPGQVPTVLLAGRMPVRPGEVVLAPGSAAAVDAGTGSTIQITGSRGSRPMTVVGIGFVPQGPHNDYNLGGWVAPAGFDALFDSFKFRFALVSLRPGADPAQVRARLERAATGVLGAPGFQLSAPDELPQVAELRQVRVLPVVLGGFLAVLAVGAVGHALATAVRRRRVDVAVLRAVGMTRWQCRGVVVTQASVLAVVGLVFGVPLGVALGRTVWRVVAEYTPLQYVPPVSLLALLLVGPAALLVANVLAAWPGQRAARLRIAHVLRAE